ncbi:MAG TPA: FapA family protein [Leptospiraceae bacterium]|nr:FapA family protein [Leptospiraceae bacterium]HMW05832.1 FapA family protein [Leptospiraceae bacterium]HMX33578.1 FapA family protein [Leptospiraceae bacterium]HMY34376.1 FapA family protein [Leptospiraceae bacterium]HMZ64132.1 FapA family protein [Leptospiraceae bacterium]
MNNNYTDSILKDLENKENGSFQIKNENNHAVLTVFKPGKNGRAVTRQEVFQRLKLFSIEGYDRAQVEVIVANADGKDHPIAIWTGGNPVDSRVELEVEPDKMSAYVIIYPALHGGKILKKADVIDILKANGIVFGLKEDVINHILDNNKFFQKTLVAEGLKPTPSVNGYIKVLFEPHSKPNLHEDAKGRIDFKDIQVIKNTKQGDVLAEKVDPKIGTPGKNIFSEEVTLDKPLEGEWKIGINCTLSDDKKKLHASIAGRPILERDGTIRVDEVCYLENVDYSTGNVDFPGTIIVDGTVADNFSLRTKGSLMVKKSVGRVFLYAERDIVLSGGVMGRNGGVIESKADVYARFVEQGNIKAGKNIIIEEASLHSELVAGDSIVIKGGRGELIGGEAIAGKSISVSKLGAVVETKTEVVVGLPPEILDELRKMKDEIASFEEVLKKVKQTMARLSDPKKELTQEEKQMLTKLYEVERKYNDLLVNSKTQYETLVVSYEPAPSAFVEVEKTLFPKVSVNLGKGKIYHSELKIYEGKCYIYNGDDGIPMRSPVPPKKKDAE